MVRILTDTASDITPSEAAALGVELVALDINFENAPYSQLQDEDFSEFYRLLAECDKLPKTSQPSPEQFLAHFEDAKQAGDSVVVVALSSGLSGTFQSACIARDILGYEEVYILDSTSAAVGQRLLVDHGVKLREQGMEAYEIYSILEEMSGRIVLFAALDTLKYLRKGGRIPKSTEIVGAMLNIKPIIAVNRKGSIDMAGKARGQAGVVTSLIKLMEKQNDFDPATPVYFGYTVEEMPCKKFQHLAVQKFRLKSALRYRVGSTIGTHVGPGAVAIAYLTRHELVE